MNQRIDNLMKMSYVDVDKDNRIFSPEKFAELIIKECANLADCPNSFKHRSGNKIRTYFGVEA